MRKLGQGNSRSLAVLCKVSCTGSGMRLSWLANPVPTNTSPIAAPRAAKPPAVPTLMIRSGRSAYFGSFKLDLTLVKRA